MTKSKLVSYGVIIAAVIVLVIIGLVTRQKSRTSPPPPVDLIESTPPPGNPEFLEVTNQLYGFKYQYPARVLSRFESRYKLPFTGTTDEFDSQVFTHTAELPYCNPKGDCERSTTDIKITIAPTNMMTKYLQTLIESSYGKMESVKIGQNIFKTVTAGVEGEGEVYYITGLSNARSLFIARRFIDENVLIGYKDKPEFIPLAEQKRITEALLASLAITDAPEEPVVSYELVHNLGGEYATHEYHDAKLIEKNVQTGQQTVLVSSIKQAIPALKISFNTTLEELSFPLNSGHLYFTVMLSETDAPLGDVYRFDISTKQFTKLALVSKYRGFGEQKISPDGLFIASTFDFEENGQVRKLYLLDLEHDTVKTLVILPANETLNSCVDGNCLGGNYGDVSWQNETTIQYAVYDSQKKFTDEYGNENRPLKEKRTIIIK